MESLSALLQGTIAASIWIVWVFRFENIVREFHQFGYPDWFRNLIGATKLSLAALLVAGIWFPALVFLPAVVMATLMVGAQLTHFRVKNPIPKFIPSLALLALSIAVAYLNQDRI
jgi:hypothetical protein